MLMRLVFALALALARFVRLTRLTRLARLDRLSRLSRLSRVNLTRIIGLNRIGRIGTRVIGVTGLIGVTRLPWTSLLLIVRDAVVVVVGILVVRDAVPIEIIRISARISAARSPTPWTAAYSRIVATDPATPRIPAASATARATAWKRAGLRNGGTA
jgi:hypothetical protein